MVELRQQCTDSLGLQVILGGGSRGQGLQCRVAADLRGAVDLAGSSCLHSTGMRGLKRPATVTIETRTWP